MSTCTCNAGVCGPGSGHESWCGQPEIEYPECDGTCDCILRRSAICDPGRGQNYLGQGGEGE